MWSYTAPRYLQELKIDIGSCHRKRVFEAKFMPQRAWWLNCSLCSASPFTGEIQTVSPVLAYYSSPLCHLEVQPGICHGRNDKGKPRKRWQCSSTHVNLSLMTSDKWGDNIKFIHVRTGIWRRPIFKEHEQEHRSWKNVMSFWGW